MKLFPSVPKLISILQQLYLLGALVRNGLISLGFFWLNHSFQPPIWQKYPYRLFFSILLCCSSENAKVSKTSIPPCTHQKTYGLLISWGIEDLRALINIVWDIAKWCTNNRPTFHSKNILLVPWVDKAKKTQWKVSCNQLPQRK